MEFALIIFALVSAAIALVMTLVVVRMLRDERRRSDDRVAALLRLANSTPAERERAVVQPRGFDEPLRSVRAASVPREPIERVTARHDGSTLAGIGPRAWRDEDVAFDSIDDFELQPEVAGVSAMFAERDQPSPWIRRAGIAAAVALLAVVVGFGISRLTRGPSVHVPAATTADAPDATAALELLTLAYEHRDGTLTINGVVQNPKSSGGALAGVEATAQLFDASGAVIASAHAPLDFSRLQPGDESPFVLRVPVKGKVARYRIGFRGEDGHVISHVDRRPSGPLARM